MKKRSSPGTWLADNTAQALLPRHQGGMSRWIKIPLILLLLYLLVAVGLGIWWSFEPDPVDPAEINAATIQPPVPGYAITATLIAVSDKLLDKPGGWLDNDKTPPGIWLDNMPNFEVGAIKQIRDLTQVMRDDLSRSQSQSAEDTDLGNAHNLFNTNTEFWMLPPVEREYRKAIKDLESYLARLRNPQAKDAQFYARADNLATWLERIEKRLGSLAQQLSASVGERRVNTDLANDPAARQSTPTAAEQPVRTPWLKIDDVFYEARGSCWALLQLLRAAETDFASVLADKRATASLQQIIRELEGTQNTVWSPMIMNGSGFGMFANHSLVMASYISRANAGLINLRRLLADD